jgi:hypothetical protein
MNFSMNDQAANAYTVTEHDEEAPLNINLVLDAQDEEQIFPAR